MNRLVCATSYMQIHCVDSSESSWGFLSGFWGFSTLYHQKSYILTQDCLRCNVKSLIVVWYNVFVYCMRNLGHVMKLKGSSQSFDLLPQLHAHVTMFAFSYTRWKNWWILFLCFHKLKLFVGKYLCRRSRFSSLCWSKWGSCFGIWLHFFLVHYS